MNRYLITGILSALALVPSLAQAGPRGPSAVAAARLEKKASGWLSFYLPNDRYKIAGGVWKYVSTDLDTYYHKPNSPNMLRQSPNRVIGFASAEDAEEAGYLPDPADGTARKVGPTSEFSSLGNLNASAAKNAAEAKYLVTLANLAAQQKASNEKLQATAMSMRGARSMASVLATVRQNSAQAFKDATRFLGQLRALKAPPRFAPFHRQLTATFAVQRGLLSDLYNLGATANMQSVSNLQVRMLSLQKQYVLLESEAKKAGLQ